MKARLDGRDHDEAARGDLSAGGVGDVALSAEDFLTARHLGERS